MKIIKTETFEELVNILLDGWINKIQIHQYEGLLRPTWIYSLCNFGCNITKIQERLYTIEYNE